MNFSEAKSELVQARNLYKKVLSNTQLISIETFHSWFLKLIRLAPLQSGIPISYRLESDTREIKNFTWLRLMKEISIIVILG